MTDANLLLGRIPPHLLDGAVPLDVAAARAAIRDGVAGPLGATEAEAARGILAIVDEAITGALKLMSVERRLDPADFALCAIGGAGPVHGGALMRLPGAGSLFVPRHPGILCAMGLLATDLRTDFVLTRHQRAGARDHAEMAAAFDELAAKGRDRLAADGVAGDRRLLTRAADLRYAGQGSELTLPFPDGPVDAAACARAVAGFHALHRRLYGFADTDAGVALLNLRVTATGLTEPIAPPGIAAARGPAVPAGERLADLGGGMAPVPVCRREALLADHVVAEPAILDQLDTTTVTLPGQTARTDRWGNLIVTEGGA